VGNTIFFPQNYTYLWQVCVLQAHTYSDRALWMQGNSCCQYRSQPNQFLLANECSQADLSHEINAVLQVFSLASYPLDYGLALR
jgi:hypothetical protein